MSLTSVEICAGAGGQALGLEQAGFKHLACVEYDPRACVTLRTNRPEWNTIEMDVTKWSGADYADRTDLLAGGVPCPPFSKAGKQLGAGDERNLFPRALELVGEINPRAVMIENVRGLLDPVFDGFRDDVNQTLEGMGYVTFWKLLYASDYGVSQLRPRAVLVALKQPWAGHFEWPEPNKRKTPSVGELLLPLMAANGWRGAKKWADQADTIAPTLVGGSHKHGGPDLGPTRARAAWAQLGVEGRTVANEAPERDFKGMPRITVEMGGLIQGFPPEWVFTGPKTHGWRQVGNAFPPPVAAAVGRQIKKALKAVGTADALESEVQGFLAQAQEPQSRLPV